MNIKTSTNYVSTFIGGNTPVGKSRAVEIVEALELQKTKRNNLDAGALAAYRGYASEVATDIEGVQGGEFGRVWDNPEENPLHDEVEKAAKEMEMTGLRAAEILLKYFDYLDSLPGTKTRKKIVDVRDLKAALQSKDIPAELRGAIEYLLSNPALIDEMNTCGADKKDDDKFGRKDFEGYIEKHQNDAPAETPAAPRSYPVPTLPTKLPAGIFPKPEPVAESEPEAIAPEPTKTPEVEPEPVAEPAPTAEAAAPVAPQAAAPAAPADDKISDLVHGIHDAINKRDGDRVIAILVSLNNEEIQQLKSRYQRSYGASLEEVLTDACSESGFRDMVSAILQGRRNESQEFKNDEVQNDAHRIKACGSFMGLNTDNATLIDIFTKRSKAHLAAVAVAFQDIHGESLRDFIDSETTGDFEDLLMAYIPS